jgi:hypothetical protein
MLDFFFHQSGAFMEEIAPVNRLFLPKNTWFIGRNDPQNLIVSSVNSLFFWKK